MPINDMKTSVSEQSENRTVRSPLAKEDPRVLRILKENLKVDTLCPEIQVHEYFDEYLKSDFKPEEKQNTSCDVDYLFFFSRSIFACSAVFVLNTILPYRLGAWEKAALTGSICFVVYCFSVHKRSSGKLNVMKTSIYGNDKNVIIDTLDKYFMKYQRRQQRKNTHQEWKAFLEDFCTEVTEVTLSALQCNKKDSIKLVNDWANAAFCHLVLVKEMVQLGEAESHDFIDTAVFYRRRVKEVLQKLERNVAPRVVKGDDNSIQIKNDVIGAITKVPGNDPVVVQILMHPFRETLKEWMNNLIKDLESHFQSVLHQSKLK
ncbi:uncharacterized protein LOC122791786 [Protopterus annectens]|uniref:uncharacterized protein LOC122791786 n=1 Tax=Protopterus annectens TaxID=7888 RepID=UPI001CFA1854|nr:uncharacterized protein LOC122791786 [Protopterus annectens]